MSAKRFLMLSGIAVLCAGWLHADTLVPGHFIIDLNNPDEDFGGWEATLTDVVNTLTPDDNSSYSPFVCKGDTDCTGDPSIRSYLGGASVPFTTSITPIDGGGVFDFENTSGTPITSILFTTLYQPGDLYSCSSDIFNFCGFQVVGANIQIAFDEGSIPSVPEPSENVFLVIAALAIAVVHRLRSRRVPA